jgi:hypothetical protein
MTVTARWHSVVVDEDDADPFADEAPLRPAQVHVPSTAKPIDLTGDEPRLSARLTETLKEEGALDAIGINCSLKWDKEISCFACPMYSGDEVSPMGKLCRLGREQERLVTLLAIAKRDGG